MARYTSAVLAALVFATTTPTQPRDDAAQSIDRVLAVQNALYLGRQHLLKGEAKQAVSVLEAELPYINGNRDYLAALRDAYWAHLKELQRAQQTEQIPAILERLRKLDPSAKLDGYTAPVPRPTPPPVMPSLPAPPPRTARGQVDDGDPFQQTPVRDTGEVRGLLQQAERAFEQNRTADAERLFAQVHASDPKGMKAAEAKWAFCILLLAAEQLNAGIPDASSLATLEKKTTHAMALASEKPELQKYGQSVLDKIRAARPGGAALAPTPGGDWTVTESANFRLHHRQPPEFADGLLRAAETARAATFEKWFGPAPAAWSARCDIFLHPTRDDFVRAAKGHPQSHGYTTVEVKASKVARRRIDLAGDNPSVLTSGLPREVAHVVLADGFPDPLLPRWADEAMAILSEPRQNVEAYLRVLPRCRRDGTLFPVGKLLTSTEFPDAAGITAFYVQSVSLVEMLVNQKGAKAFAIFLQDSRRYGSEKALERNYQIRSFQELQERWQRAAALE